ncbi:MAG: RagB/SusD family nutrient uptake outer membrane protein [Candidatus Pedobacter colombiensis]|uniref:RagB/SusD family nutrient uptake outer membrane protein n=1 Tax=Candidatus Pedobacter colombiensis TaxID=3121371 RepID=A0AAJ6BA59_9SPHI|nr:RagB/SusD family nutrient uptake outer membrane protein [Pedobacter sp.]WEK20928.1 MAG: RagB/SusD family nutrient uptake outer membrane protein [Pedobacter sp.]
MKLAYKKSVILLCIGVLVLAGSSCKKYLDIENPSTISQDVAFASTSYTNTAIIGVYNQLPGDNGITKEGTIWSASTDEFKTSGSYSVNDRRGVSMYLASQSNGELLDAFKQLYTGVERANTCIKGINNSALYTEGSASKVTMNRYMGEALTLRALFYFVLVRNWGSVVAQWEPSGDFKEWDVPVTASTEILDRLLADLKQAEDLVPWRSDSGYSSTRWTKGAIKALRARIALFRGGYMMNKESHTMVRSSDYKKYYQIALDECKDIMARRDQHNLNPVYENIFKSLHTSTRNDPTNELMFEVGAYGAGSRTDTKLGYYNGLRINTAARFGGGGGGLLAIATYFYEFDQLGDCRRDVTIGSYEIDGTSQKVMNTLNNMTDAKFRRSWTNMTGTTQTLGVNWPVIRFADVLLMFAEADNEINGGPSVLAQEALSEVRKRAYVGFLGRLPAMPTDYNTFFEAIVKERLLEFGGEAIRKYDLMRWNLMGAKFAETRVKLRQLMNGEGAYVNVPKYVYSKAAAYNVVGSQEEFNTLDTYGGSPAVTLFQPGLGVSKEPTGYVTKNWRASLNEEYITGNSTGFATYFESNKREVFPFHETVLLYNTKIIQNYGY